MPRFSRCARIFAALASLLLTVGSVAAQQPQPNWADFRGPRGDGVAVGAQPPIHWSESDQVRWKAPVPGRGWSSPVLWGNQIWVTSASEDGKTRYAFALDASTGSLLFEISVFEVDEPEPINQTNSYASPSPVIEEGRVYVHFGTVGTACIDTATGQILWKRDDMPIDHKEGAGSSPLLAGDLLVIPFDGLDVQYVVALNKQTGQTVWKTDRSVDFSNIRDDMRKAYSTPFLYEEEGRQLVIVTGAQATMAYELETGKEVWKYTYNGFSNVGRPVIGHRLAFLNTGYMRPRIAAVRLGRTGLLKDEDCVWSVERAAPNKPSLLLVEDLLYMVTDKGGVLTCLHAQTGEIIYQERLGGNFSASPLFANGLIYLCDEEGRTTVVRHGRNYEVVAVNELEDGCLASPAAVGRSLFLRTRRHLYRIGE